MTDVAFSVIAYSLPLAALPFVVRLAPAAKRVAGFALFASPLVGAATCLIAERHADSPPGLRSIAQLAVLYPFALLPLGFWAAALGALGTWWLDNLHGRFSASTLGFPMAGVLGGAITGAGFMAVSTAAAEALGPPASFASWYVMAGALAGSTVGMFAAVTIMSRGASSHPRGA
jgi:hypothetical protein